MTDPISGNQIPEPPEATPEQLVTELAPASTSVLRPIWNGTWRVLDDTLIAKGGASNLALKIYDDIERDTQASALITKRVLAVTGRPWSIQPASDRLRDAKIAKEIEDRLREAGIDDAARGLMDALLKGFAVSEVIWRNSADGWWPERFVARDQRRFVFAEDGAPRLVTPSTWSVGETLPDQKFIVHAQGGKDGNPQGLGLGTRLYWPTWFKKQALQFWLAYADKFGQPTIVGKYPNGATANEQATLLKVIQAISQETGIALPEGMSIELLEATRAGSVDTYQRLLEYLDQQMSVAVLGETLTTSMQGSSGSRAAGQVHNEVRLEFVAADALALDRALTHSIVRWCMDLNYPGAPYPKFERPVTEDEDLLTRAQRDQILYAIGWEPAEDDYVSSVYGDSWRRKAPPVPVAPVGSGAPIATPVAGGTPAPAPAFATSDPTLAEANAAVLAPSADRAMARMIGEIEAAFASASSLEEYAAILLTIQPSLKPDDLARLLANGMLASDLAGRADVIDHA